jgi:hypothetical protein
MRHIYVVPMRWMVIYECEVPEGAYYPDHGHHGNFPLQVKIPMVEPGPHDQ